MKFCIQIVIQILEHVPKFEVLFFGRILGGLSTALLFTAFEVKNRAVLHCLGRKNLFILSAMLSIGMDGHGASSTRYVNCFFLYYLLMHFYMYFVFRLHGSSAGVNIFYWFDGKWCRCNYCRDHRSISIG